MKFVMDKLHRTRYFVFRGAKQIGSIQKNPAGAWVSDGELESNLEISHLRRLGHTLKEAQSRLREA